MSSSSRSRSNTPEHPSHLTLSTLASSPPASAKKPQPVHISWTPIQDRVLGVAYDEEVPDRKGPSGLIVSPCDEENLIVFYIDNDGEIPDEGILGGQTAREQTRNLALALKQRVVDDAVDRKQISSDVKRDSKDFTNYYDSDDELRLNYWWHIQLELEKIHREAIDKREIDEDTWTLMEVGIERCVNLTEHHMRNNNYKRPQHLNDSNDVMYDVNMKWNQIYVFQKYIQQTNAKFQDEKRKHTMSEGKNDEDGTDLGSDEVPEL
jgi:hypothetical protein